MAHTPRDRARARRLRQRKRPLSPEERDWLTWYENDSSSRGPRPSIVSKERATVPESRAQVANVTETPASPSNGAGVSSIPLDPEVAIPSFPPIDESPEPEPQTINVEAPSVTVHTPPPKPATEQRAAPSASGCAIPDCPACMAAGEGGQVCTVTGKRVHPKMSRAAAKANAAVWLKLIGGGVSLFVTKESAPPPTKAEINDMAEAIGEFAYRRASWFSMYDDIAAFLGESSAYGARAIADGNSKKRAKMIAIAAEMQASEPNPIAQPDPPPPEKQSELVTS